jgi:Tol biopolymer transport system component
VQRRRLRPNGHGGGRLTYESEAVWIASLDGVAKRQVTPWRNGLKEVPSSYSPDGSRLAVTRAVGGRPDEALAIGLAGGGSTVLARGALDPVYSPDGAEIAYLRGRQHTARNGHGTTSATLTDLFAMRADGSGSRQLTNTPKAVEIAPSWDPSGRRLAFTLLRNPFTQTGLAGFGDAIMEVNADGSCPAKILSSPRVMYFGATWQPGQGRDAAPVTC